jgi:septal ring factor EnvC (AmiA/AmiB activator)
MRRLTRQVLLAVALLAAPAGARLAAQQGPEARLKAQRDSLERIKEERRDLEARMAELQTTAHDLSEEVANLDRQADATARLVRSLDSQLAAITDEIASETGNLARAQDELVVKRATLDRRLQDIYKRGPLYSLEVLLSAESFGALVARYKYLHQVALRDRALVKRVEELQGKIVHQRELLVRLGNDIAVNRTDKVSEERRLRVLELERERNLAQVNRSTHQLQSRLEQIARDEARVSGLIATLESERNLEEAKPNAAPAIASALRTADFGKLAWPVDGTIIYRFGRVVNPNNTTTRWNGIGIAAPQGTAVKAIAGGEVAIAEGIGTYGLTVIVQHGGGDYSVYGSLSRIDVRKGDKVDKGQVLGAVGSADPDLQAHLHFEIRRARGVAVDPLDWLRKER